MRKRLTIYEGDITKLHVDAIVNAANNTLLGGGGVDGAIHRAAGPKLREECKKIGGCPIGEARVTKGYNLPAKYVIHTVGPVWKGGSFREDRLLEDCYRNTLNLAEEYKIRTIAFPSISTGSFGYPVEPAAEIAVNVCKYFLDSSEIIEEIIFVCFDRLTASIYEELLKQVGKK